MPYFAISLDDFSEDGPQHLERAQDGLAGHYAAFEADTKEAAVDRALAALRPLIEGMIYESDEYGRRAR